MSHEQSNQQKLNTESSEAPFNTKDGETEVRVLDSFLEEIIWSKADRDEDVERVISAGFGPLAALMTVVKPECQKIDGSQLRVDANCMCAVLTAHTR